MDSVAEIFIGLMDFFVYICFTKTTEYEKLLQNHGNGRCSNGRRSVHGMFVRR